MRIWILGDLRDLSSTYISWLAQRRDFEVVELNEDVLRVDWTFTYTDTDTNIGYFEKSGERYPFPSFSGAFVRLNPEPSLPSHLTLPPEEAGVLVVERRHAIQHLLNSLPFTIANRPYSGRANGSKPYQMNLLAKAGFPIPKWIASNEENVIKDFLHQCQSGAIYKSSQDFDLRYVCLMTNCLEDYMTEHPQLLCRNISKDTMLDTCSKASIFATKVISHGIDYRFENENNEFQETSAPDQIQTCVGFLL